MFSRLFPFVSHLQDVHILDAGCGTGNYSKALLQLGVGKISMFDASMGMLKQAENKLRLFIDEGRVGELSQGILPKIPFESNQFDAIMFNCVSINIKIILWIMMVNRILINTMMMLLLMVIMMMMMMMIMMMMLM